MNKKNTFLFLLLSQMANAYDAKIDGIYYNFSRNEAIVTYQQELLSGSSQYQYYTYYSDYSGTVVIPEFVTYKDKSYSVTSIGNYAFCGCSGLTSVTIPNSVTSIGSDAFNGCSGLTSVTIPNSVTSIGNDAFEGCSGLTSITIGNSVKSIGEGAFRDCSGLKEVNFNATKCTRMGSNWSHVFVYCTSLTTLNIGNNVQYIPSYAFYGCSGLTSIDIPNSVIGIGDYAFADCI